MTLGSIFNYLGEYVQLPWGAFFITLGSIFNYHGGMGGGLGFACEQLISEVVTQNCPG